MAFKKKSQKKIEEPVKSEELVEEEIKSSSPKGRILKIDFTKHFRKGMEMPEEKVKDLIDRGIKTDHLFE